MNSEAMQYLGPRSPAFSGFRMMFRLSTLVFRIFLR